MRARRGGAAAGRRTARGKRHAAARTSKPWGWELLWARTDRYAGKILHIERGAALSYQFHRRKDETIYLLRGSLDLDFAAPGGRRRRWRMRPGDGLRIQAGDRHRMTAVTACDVLEASTPELDDVVRLEDRYGRADDGHGARWRGSATSGQQHGRGRSVARRGRARG